MKLKLINQTLFIGKSLAWSVLFYFTAMAIINWEEYSKKGNTKSWAVTTHAGEKELIPVKVIVDNNKSPLMSFLLYISKAL